MLKIIYKVNNAEVCIAKFRWPVVKTQNVGSNDLGAAEVASEIASYKY